MLPGEVACRHHATSLPAHTVAGGHEPPLFIMHKRLPVMTWRPLPPKVLFVTILLISTGVLLGVWVDMNLS